MKKSIIAIAAIVCAMGANAQTNDRELNEFGQKVYADCLAFSDKIGEFFNDELKKEYSENCPSLAFSLEDSDQVKRDIVSNITKEDFNPTSLISMNEFDYMYKLGLVTSFLIESPSEKLELMDYLAGPAKTHSPEEQQDTVQKLDVKYKDFKIDKVFYSNLLKAKNVLNQDYERMITIQQDSSKRILDLAEKFKQENAGDQEKLERVNALIETTQEGDVEYQESIKAYLDNLNKYLASPQKANLVYTVFNTKNPLFVADNFKDLPIYKKSECEVLDDWKLGDLAKEKYQVSTIKGCK